MIMGNWLSHLEHLARSYPLVSLLMHLSGRLLWWSGMREWGGAESFGGFERFIWETVSSCGFCLGRMMKEKGSSYASHHTHTHTPSLYLPHTHLDPLMGLVLVFFISSPSSHNWAQYMLSWAWSSTVRGDEYIINRDFLHKHSPW